MNANFNYKESHVSSLPSHPANLAFKLALHPSLTRKAIYLFAEAILDPFDAHYFVECELIFSLEGVPKARVPFSIGNDPTGNVQERLPRVLFATSTPNPGPDSIKVHFGQPIEGGVRSASLNPNTLFLEADEVRLEVKDFKTRSGHVIDGVHVFLAVKETL